VAGGGSKYLGEAFGQPTGVETLGGQSAAAVYRVRFVGKSLIVKTSPIANEAVFYEKIAPLLQARSIDVPVLERSFCEAGRYWLVLEDVPHPLPATRRQADDQMIEVLYRLHTFKLEQLPPGPGWYRPKWTAPMTELALECLPPEVARPSKPFLYTLQNDYQHLFKPQNLISGDPNPGNWGLREDGTLVLFDWERFSYGTPALDLAITVGGVGNVAGYAATAVKYLRTNKDLAASEIMALTRPLARDIAIAKIWTVVEYLSEYRRGKMKPGVTLDKLLPIIVEWLAIMPGVLKNELG
jgi:aminoglycoside phosphotransferase (APT) family kinase protein